MPPKAKTPKLPKSPVTRIEIPELDIQTIDVTVVGDEGLITHAWSVKAKREMLGKQQKKAMAAPGPKDPFAEFRSGLYVMEDGGYGLPSVAFKNAAVTTCTSIANVTKVAARQAFHIVGEKSIVDGAFETDDGQPLKMRQDLVRILGASPQIREDMVRIGQCKGTAALRYRPDFWPWYAHLSIRYNTAALSPSQIINLINNSGFGVGVGEWRPEKDGQSGLFHVAKPGEVAALVADLAEAA